MKLKNKRTGEIVMICKINPEPYEAREFECNSLSELNEEWEDYEEEEKEYYTLNSSGQIWTTECFDEKSIKNMVSIGNYFDTREEAEQAVEKLKAWKRLKDKGFRFSKWFTRVEGGIQINMKYNKYDGIDSECREDLDLLFGGEE